MAEETKSLVKEASSSGVKAFAMAIGAWLAKLAILAVPLALVFFLARARVLANGIDGLSPRLLFWSLVLASFALVALFIERRHLRAEISRYSADFTDFVAHYGVQWKVDRRIGAVHESPYCLCCAPPRPLSQTAWRPSEKFKCTATGQEYQLAGGAPITSAHASDDLHKGLFVRGDWAREQLAREFNRLKDLYPARDDHDIVGEMFAKAPLNRIPWYERAELLAGQKRGIHALRLITDHYTYYGTYLERRGRPRRWHPLRSIRVALAIALRRA